MSALRLYLPGVDEFAADGYPVAWASGDTPVKDLVRDQAEHRCVRCGHPYRKGQHGNGEWSPCDERCEHVGPWRIVHETGEYLASHTERRLTGDAFGIIGEHKDWQEPRVEARWRILTVHHLNGVKADLRWHNLVALCQVCHLRVQGRTRMEQVYPFEHSTWFKPYAAAYYAATYLGEELSRDEAMERLDELLGLERVA